MSKFDNYFKIHTSTALSIQEVRFNDPILVWDKSDNEWGLYLIQQQQQGSEIHRDYMLSNGRYNWVTSNEDDIYLDWERYPSTKLGNLLYG